MPTRTVMEELCDFCFKDNDKEVEASDRLQFGVDGKEYMIFACERHSRKLNPVRELIDFANAVIEPRRNGHKPQGAAKTVTLFSQLDPEEKERFRSWADMPTARRIKDSRVQEWLAAGRP